MSITAHINQMVNADNQLEGGDGLFIDLKYMGDQACATSAIQYEIDEDGEESEEILSAHDALQDWKQPISNGHGIDGVLAVLCPDQIWRKLVWFNEDGHGQAFLKD
tara:strand:+ start:131 stop:448 length:318 start_codon:yes stop_codon:yes gene_type:complete